MNIKKFAAIFGLTLILGGMLPGGVYARWSPDANQRKAERRFIRSGGKDVATGFYNDNGKLTPLGYSYTENGLEKHPTIDVPFDTDKDGVPDKIIKVDIYQVALPVEQYIRNVGNSGFTEEQIKSMFWTEFSGEFNPGQGVTTESTYNVPDAGYMGAPMEGGGFSGFYKAGGKYYPIGEIVRAAARASEGGGGDYPYPTYPPLPTWTPTPTPTPTTAPLPWSKIKDSSYMGESIVSRIPASPIAYDEEDTAQPYLIIGEGGPVMAPYIGIMGLNASARPNASNWQSVYEPRGFYNDTMGFENFASYVKARKTYTSISSLSEINGDGIYMWTGVEAFEITEVPSAFNQYNVVLVSTAPITINLTGSFSPLKSVAILSSSISFAPTVREARGIFIGSQVATGTTTDQGLKIIGNLIAKDNMVDGRRWSTLSRPSLFIVFKPEMYTDLLPYLSVANYEWEQTQ
ncbi:MAG: hypothetical protein ACOYYJ_13435 [Chloroflexota bacterium]